MNRTPSQTLCPNYNKIVTELMPEQVIRSL